MLVAPNFEIDPRTRTFQRTLWGVYSGDEPHYLISINSLIKDGDLDISNNYENIHHGGLDAGERFKGRRLDHHTHIIDKKTGKRWFWHSVFDYKKRKPCSRDAPDHECFEKRFDANIDFENKLEVNGHPLMFSAILVASIAPFFPEEDQVERYCGVALVLYSWLTLVLLYIVGKRVGLSRIWAILSIVALCFASPWFAYSRSFFTENLSALMLVAGLLALLNKRIVLTGVFLSVAMAIKPVYVVFGFGWIAHLLIERQFKSAFKLTFTMGILGIGICVFNYWHVGTIFLTGSQKWPAIESISELHAEFTDSVHGLFVFVPWAVFVVWILIHSFERARKSKPGFELLIALPSLFYCAVITAHGGLSGYCYGPRYWVPLLPFFALVLARNIPRLEMKTTKAIVWLSVAAGALVAIPGILYYRFIWSQRYDQAFYYFLSYLGFR